MTEKYIYCPSCRTLTIHKRITKPASGVEGGYIGWICEQCNPPLEDFA